MRVKVIPLLLIVMETISYILICRLLNMTEILMLKSGIIYFLFMFIYGHYSLSTNLIWNEIRQLCKSHFCFFIALLIFASDTSWGTRKLHIILLTVIMFIISLFFTRMLRIVFRSRFASRTLVIGTGEDAARFGKIAHNNRFSLTSVLGYIDVNHCGKLRGLKQDNVILEYDYDDEDVKDKVSKEVYPYKELNNVIELLKINQIIVIVPEANRKQIDTIMKDIHNKANSVKYLPDVNGLMTFSSEIQDYDGLLLVSTSKDKMNFLDRFVKRGVDICAAIAGMLILGPLYVYVKHKNKQNNDNNPVIFTQSRIGLNGKPIKIYKFRSMVPNAEKLLHDLMESDPLIKEEYLTNKKLKNDPRITPVGAMLRKTSLDEFPQFINVLKGEMSFVGPRPYLFGEIGDMGIYYDSIIKCKPGITGMWQANGRSDVGFEDRCKLDDYYYRNWSIWLDLTIIYKTVKSVLYGKGAL